MQFNEIKIGMIEAFTGKYQSVRVIQECLKNIGFHLIVSKNTTPEIIKQGTISASADFCFPLRVFVGHARSLLHNNPDLDILLTPIVQSENQYTVTCAKYRDVGGVVIRSLDSKVKYNQEMLSGERKLRILEPIIKSLDYQHLENLCFDIVSDILKLPKNAKVQYFFPKPLQPFFAKEKQIIEQAFNLAYEKIINQQKYRYWEKLQDYKKIRLGLVGRIYLLDDPLLSNDIKRFFVKKGVEVFVPEDISFKELERFYQKEEGFYDSYRLHKSFVDYSKDKLDGYILVGSFGCHPDAFQQEYLHKYLQEQGIASWVLKFDEHAGSAGFLTRFETIYGFLANRRDRRIADTKRNKLKINEIKKIELNEKISSTLATNQDSSALEIKETFHSKKPLFLWPHMGITLDIMLEEGAYQLGLQDYIFPPLPTTEKTIELGKRDYAESCSPFALSFGSAKETIERAVRHLEEEARKTESEIEPRRFILLMAKSNGPCTFGWYYIIMQRELKKFFQPFKEKYGHSLEVGGLNIHGDNLEQFVNSLLDISNSDLLKELAELLTSLSNESNLKKGIAQLRLWRTLKRAVHLPWLKLLIAEKIKQKALIVRAHELELGHTTLILKQIIEDLRKAHTEQEVYEIFNTGLKRLDNLPQDQKIAPRVVALGEIYVALTSYANRGTIDNLLGRHGIEVIQGLTLSQFIRYSLRELKRESLIKVPFIAWLKKSLTAKNINILEAKIREMVALPLLEHEVGGDGVPSVAHAREYVEKGADGIVHVYPFKCMPEGIAKDALKELSNYYGVHYLPLSFDKETEIERLKTEIATFAHILKEKVNERLEKNIDLNEIIAERKNLGKNLDSTYQEVVRKEHLKRF